jgi:hypothetical protein
LSSECEKHSILPCHPIRFLEPSSQIMLKMLPYFIKLYHIEISMINLAYFAVYYLIILIKQAIL